jgi:CheY-like chemotaxis protein
MDGYEVARALRADENLRPMLLVALTGYAQPEDLRRAAAAGFDAHVAKPASIQTIEEVLSRLEKDLSTARGDDSGSSRSEAGPGG